MKASRFSMSIFALLVVVGLFAASAHAAPAPQGKKPEAKPQAKAGLPKEIAALIQEGLATRQGRQDMPFSFFKTLILPAREGNLYPVFFFKAKNADLGYVPSSSGSGEMETTLNVFFQFYQMDPAAGFKPFWGGKSAAVLKAEGAGYEADKEAWYSFGLTMPPAKYLLALALTTPDMKKMSVGYAEFELPTAETLQSILLPSDPVIVESLQQVEFEQRVVVHRGCFNWGAFQVTPNLGGELKVGQTPEVLFFVNGATTKDPAAARPANDIEVNFEIQGPDGKAAIRWPPVTYESYFVSQPLPLVQTLQTTDEKGNVVETKQKPLAAGKYTLVCQVTDKVANKKAETKLAFELK